MEFTVIDGVNSIKFSDWSTIKSLLSPTGLEVSPAPLLFLYESEKAFLSNNETTLKVPNEEVASSSESEKVRLGFPPVLPYLIEIRSKGRIDNLRDEFRLKVSYKDNRGRPIRKRVRPKGPFLVVGEEKYSLNSELFQIIHLVDEFEYSKIDNHRDRFELWGRIKALLPEDAIVDDHLKPINVMVATAFSVKPNFSDVGKPSFDVILGYNRPSDSNEELLDFTEQKSFDTTLPVARQEQFNNYFRSDGEPKRQYPCGGNWYVFIEPDLRKALTVVRKVSESGLDTVHRFLENPRTYIREKLGDEIDEETLENMFHELSFGDRVRGVAEWQVRVVPWITKPTEQWLPPETLGIRFGNVSIEIDKKDIPTLKERVKEALDKGKTAIPYKGYSIPASHETIGALNGLIAEVIPNKDEIKPSGKDGGDRDRYKENRKRYVLEIEDNFDEVTYKATGKKRRRTFSDYPKNLKSKLYDHQTAAFNWLKKHWKFASPGALLADDMGLGKTLVSLSFLSWVQDQFRADDKHKPLLIVAPTGLLKNWLDEIFMHLQEPGLGEILRCYASGLRKLKNPHVKSLNEITKGHPILDTESLKSCDLALTTYESMRDYRMSFALIQWGCIVFDEAQKIKNPSSDMTDAAKAMQSEFILALTGTPVENRLADLWCILDTVQPGRLGSVREFSKKYEAPTRNKKTEALDKLRSFLTDISSPPIMLRRFKEEHIDCLPTKKIEIYKETMPDAQAIAYKDIIKRERETTGKQILRVLNEMRNSSLHPYLKRNESDDDYINDSARLRAVFEILDRVYGQNEKALLFVESREMQQILCEIIQRKYRLGSPPLIINGKISGEKRKARVDAFQNRSGFGVMILSPKAGGVGLNITAASHVVHVSRWWNPATEDQCNDRVYRIGQKKDVTIHVPLAIHPEYGDYSYDLKLHDLLEKKRSLSRTMLEPPTFTSEESRYLFQETISGGRANGAELQANLNSIDLMEPVQFEEWILKQFSDSGYEVKKTGDCELDGLAVKGDSGWAIQIKHIQGNYNCPDKAVQKVIEGINYYPEAKGYNKLVVTNAKDFTSAARSLAKEQGVKLVDRWDLLDQFFNNL